MSQVQFATPTNIDQYGEYKFVRKEGDTRPTYRFTERISNEVGTQFAPEAGRYHLYAGWFCPWSQRVTLQIALNRLEDVISVSYVDNSRDARGWAFREIHGPDPVNGFTLLREAYEKTEPGFDGHISVPTLWDKKLNRIVSNDFKTIGIDFATQFKKYSNGAELYPTDLKEEIEEFDRLIGPTINQGVSPAARGDSEAILQLTKTLELLNERLTNNRFLLGETLTEADIRLWVTLVRFDVNENSTRKIIDGLHIYPNLWSYARELYSLPEFARTTNFEAFTAPGAEIPNWKETPHRKLTIAQTVGS